MHENLLIQNPVHEILFIWNVYKILHPVIFPSLRQVYVLCSVLGALCIVSNRCIEQWDCVSEGAETLHTHELRCRLYQAAAI